VKKLENTILQLFCADKENSTRWHDYDGKSGHSLIKNPKLARLFEIPHESILILNFQDWADGEDIREEKLSGFIIT
jgi:hypothetical protein